MVSPGSGRPGRGITGALSILTFLERMVVLICGCLGPQGSILERKQHGAELQPLLNSHVMWARNETTFVVINQSSFGVVCYHSLTYPVLTDTLSTS